MARKLRLIVFSLLAAGMVVFIFSNSFQSSEASNAASGWVADFLRPLLNPRGRIADDTYHKLVRKLAHFAEFGLLGFWFGGIAANVRWKRKWLCAASAAVLIACTDETIQSFTGRTNSIKDVCIDGAGAICGIAAMALIVLLIGKNRVE